MKIFEFLKNETSWTKWALARNKKGTPTLLYSLDAICWCLSAAIEKCYKPDKRAEIFLKLSKAINPDTIESDVSTVIYFNDSYKTTHADIIAICKKANV